MKTSSKLFSVSMEVVIHQVCRTTIMALKTFTNMISLTLTKDTHLKTKACREHHQTWVVEVKDNSNLIHPTKV